MVRGRWCYYVNSALALVNQRCVAYSFAGPRRLDLVLPRLSGAGSGELTFRVEVH